MINPSSAVLSSLIVALLATLISASRTGAPAKACDNLTPKHPGTFKTTPSPCTLNVEKMENGTYKICLSAPEFKGFALAIQDKSDKAYLGDWSKVANAKVLECNTGKVITHTSNQVKHDITLYWNPKPGDEGKTKQIFGACVQDYKNYWRVEQDL